MISSLQKSLPLLCLVLMSLLMHHTNGDISHVVDVCCEIGTRWSRSNSRCDDYIETVGDISNEEQLTCRMVIEVCCLKSKQQEMCQAGKNFALSEEGQCVVRDNTFAAVTYKECCQCCQMGKITRQMGMSCEMPSIGNPCDQKFMECCVGISDDPYARNLTTDNTTVVSGDEIDECVTFGAKNLCNQICINTIGSFRCDCEAGHRLALDGRTCYTDNCPAGLAFNTVSLKCEDIDECVIGRHDCQAVNEICINRMGGYHCDCEEGYYRNRLNSICEDIDECARRMDNCTSSQRCENKMGSYVCRRITPCGTGWTLNEETQECIDQNECEVSTHNCGTGYECYNIEGSFRCNPRGCPEGSRFSSTTGKCERVDCPRGLRVGSTSLCVDIDECARRDSPCRSHQRCVNTYGSYHCVDTISCSPGFEVRLDGSTCEDIDECKTGKHDCQGGAECINRQGSYICSCPDGYRRERDVCEDKNECLLGNACSNNAFCENTRGSYRCVCARGFYQVGQQCADVDECNERNICSHGCMNHIGSYTCTCESGYKLAPDDRTCIDIDECQLSNLGICMGECVNTPGSYICSCPSGWRILANTRTCQDIDECAEGLDRCSNDDEMCFNTRGSHKCPRVTCPPDFSRSELGPRRNSVRCKRLNFICNPSDQECMTAPLSLSYNFLTFPTNVKVPTDLFSMSGPQVQDRSFNWHLNVSNVFSRQLDVQPARRQDFNLTIGRNHAIVTLINRIQGPQDIELMLTMYITDRYSGTTGHAVSHIYLYVTSENI